MFEMIIAWGLHQGFAHILVHCEHHLYNEEDERYSLDKQFQGSTPVCHCLRMIYLKERERALFAFL